MKYNGLDNQAFAALANGLPVPLAVTMEGTGSAVAWIEGNLIIADLSAAEVSKYVNLSTPIDFELIDMHTIHQNATACTIQAANTAAAITDAVSLAASDKDIDRAAEIDDAAWSFDKDDNDLRLLVATGAATARVVMLISK